jgi:hypothetical protein
MATVTASYNWVSGETVTPAKLNTTAAPTVVVADNEVTTAKILDANVTTAKIADANVTNAKLASDIDASKLTTGTLPIARIADAAVTPAKLSQPLTLATAQTTTSGTSIDFTGIPSWVKRITVMFSGVSTNGTSVPIIQLGDSGGIEATGYNNTAVSVAGGGVGAATYTTGFGIVSVSGLASFTLFGFVQISALSANSWTAFGGIAIPNVAQVITSGAKELSGTLDRIRLTTVNGTDTFDAGSVNIMYEG